MYSNGFVYLRRFTLLFVENTRTSKSAPFSDARFLTEWLNEQRKHHNIDVEMTNGIVESEYR